jgi:uracil-DNA glycosylase
MPTIVLVGEARGEAEERLNSSFVGPTGTELLRMMGEAELIHLTTFDRDHINSYYKTRDSRFIERVWRSHPEVFRTNVFNQHPPQNDMEFFYGPKSTALPGYGPIKGTKYVRAEFEPELNRLCAEILSFNPNLIVALGNTPLWALTNKSKITKFRGSTLLSTHCVGDYKVLPTFHPSYVVHNYPSRPTVIQDLRKAKVEAESPEIIRPEREIWIEPTIEDIKRFISTYIYWTTLLSVDIETLGERITCIGFAPNSSRAIVIPFDDERKKNKSYWATLEEEKEVWDCVQGVLQSKAIPKLFQNGLYDITFLWRAYGIKVFGAQEDTMLLAHALEPEKLKDLGTLGSLYSNEFAWKQLGKRYKTIKRGN